MKTANLYRHIFFDLDETLWDFKRNSLETIHDLITNHQLDKLGVERTFFIERYHHHNEYFWDLYRKGKISREELRTVRWKTTLGEFDIHDEAVVKNLSEEYLQILPTKKYLYSDARDLLEYLKPKYSLHIITNGFEEVQLQKIQTSEIASYFTHIITSERAGSQKPQREIFLFALNLTGGSIQNSLFIGDSIEADIAGAKSVGMDHVLFNPQKIPHHESVMLEISELNELKQYL
ncbi:MAG: YjjG family noncanonical pyrimidine nucleotidase [Chitinophagales bacterium]